MGHEQHGNSSGSQRRGAGEEMDKGDRPVKGALRRKGPPQAPGAPRTAPELSLGSWSIHPPNPSPSPSRAALGAP